MTDTVAPTNDIAGLLTDVLRVETLISMAIARFDVPAAPSFDPHLGLTTLQAAAIQLHSATSGPGAPKPTVAVTADSGEQALRLARAHLVAAGEAVVDLLRAAQTTTANRRLLSDILRLLSEAHEELFGERW